MCNIRFISCNRQGLLINFINSIMSWRSSSHVSCFFMAVFLPRFYIEGEAAASFIVSRNPSDKSILSFAGSGVVMHKHENNYSFFTKWAPCRLVYPCRYDIILCGLFPAISKGRRAMLDGPLLLALFHPISRLALGRINLPSRP